MISTDPRQARRKQLSLLDDIRSESRPGGPMCGIAILRSQMSDTDRADLDAALNDRSINATAIYRVLSSPKYSDRYTYHISAYSIQSHRRGDCRCS